MHLCLPVFKVPELMAPPEVSALSSSSLKVLWNSTEGRGIIARGRVTEYRVNLLTEQTTNPYAPPVVSQASACNWYRLRLHTHTMSWLTFSIFRSCTERSRRQSRCMSWQDWSRTMCTTSLWHSAQRQVALPVCPAQDGPYQQVKHTEYTLHYTNKQLCVWY